MKSLSEIANSYHYIVEYSKNKNLWVGRVEEFPDLSYCVPGFKEAELGIRAIVIKLLINDVQN